MSSIATRWVCVGLWALALVPALVGSAPPVQDWVAVSPGPGDVWLGSNRVPQSQRALAVDAAGNSYVTGHGYNGSDYDYLTQKYDANGLLLWSVTYNGPGNADDFALALALDASGNVVVTGYSGGIGTGDDYATLKYASADGAPMWSGGSIVAGAARYNGPGNGFDEASALALDASGNVVVTGASYNGINNDYATLKYASANGLLLWSVTYNGPSNRNDNAYALALDASGNVGVTGQSVGSASSWDYATLKYASANGALMWSGGSIVAGAARYNGPANSHDDAYALALDASGNVVVTGRSYNGSNWDYATLKYASANGAPMWSGGAARYNGPAVNSDDYAYALALDASGNVVVTGTSSNGSNADFATLKYASADGAPMWSGGAIVAGAARYNGLANMHDDAYALALDASGNVVVTGESDGGGTWYDYATLKYAASDGAETWVHRYDGGAASVEMAHALAIAPDASLRIAGTAITLEGPRIAVLKLRDNPDIFADSFETLTSLMLTLPTAEQEMVGQK